MDKEIEINILKEKIKELENERMELLFKRKNYSKEEFSKLIPRINGILEKINELGLGKRVVQQLGDTAVGAIENVVSPLTEWLEKYEHVYDQNIFNTEMQSMGKQMFFAKQALSAEASVAPVPPLATGTD